MAIASRIDRPNHFIAEVVGWVPSGVLEHWFRWRANKAVEFHGGGWLYVRVRMADGHEWYGHFQNGPSRVSVDGLVATPDENYICVIAKGCAFIVNIGRPSEYEILPANPVKEIYSFEADGVLLLCSDVAVAGLMAGGQYWLSEQLASDGIRDVTMQNGQIVGQAWSAPDDDWVMFSLNPATGQRKAE